jgi:hypothetical protein
MKKLFYITCIIAISYQNANSQADKIQGKPITEVFTDFHYAINDSSKFTGFDLNRAYLGYKYMPEGDFYATIIVNVGTPLDLAAGSIPRRYSYFREASITYTKDKLTVTAGITGTRIFDFQQKYWGKRYLANTFQSSYGYGSVADLGIVLDYKINNILKADLAAFNGEGYTNVQRDNSIKVTGGLTITPPNNFSFRIYSDIIKIKDVWQSTFVTFAGFKNKVISIGTDVSFKTHLDLTEGHDVWGISATGSLFPDRKYEYFARFDYSASAVMPGEELPWDNKLDGSYLITGIQRNFSTNIKLALNYRSYMPYNSDIQHTKAIYLNALFRF